MKKKQIINNILNEGDTPAGKVFSIFIQLLIILSLVTFSVETLPNLPQKVQSALNYIEIIIVSIFTLEYILRIVTSESRIRFVFSFYGLIDLAAILPFYIASGLDLRSVRVFRCLRLIRILKLFRYNQAIGRFKRAVIIAKEDLVIFSIVTLMILFLSAVGIYYFEHRAQPDVFQSIFHSLWWAVATLTTVGYGDIYPITAGGRIFTFFVLMTGLGIVAVPTGLLASALTQAREEEGGSK